MTKSQNRVARALALGFSGALFVLAIANAQTGCSTPSPTVSAEDRPSPPAARPLPSDNGAPDGAPDDAAAPASGTPANAAPSASAPDAAESADPETWFPASKSGAFVPPRKKDQAQNTDGEPQRQK